MTSLNITGLGVALATPFNEDNTIDFESLQNLIRHVIDGGCDYIVVLGTTAETPCLTFSEKKEIAEFVADQAYGHVPLVLGMGGNNTAGVINEIKKFDLKKYSAILSVTPYYNKPTQEGLFRHFKSICDASPLPLILYNVPSRTGVNLTPHTTVRLAHYSDKIYAVKEASGDLKQSIDILSSVQNGFYVISGNDADTLPLIKAGAIGLISVLANALPAEMKKMVDLCLKGEYEKAILIQEKVKPLIGSIFEEGNPAGIKSLLSQFGLIKNILRLPLVPVSEQLAEKLKKELEVVKAE